MRQTDGRRYVVKRMNDEDIFACRQEYDVPSRYFVVVHLRYDDATSRRNVRDLNHLVWFAILFDFLNMPTLLKISTKRFFSESVKR